jgi:ABC-2 type transport system ATP-binding protein
LELFARLYDVPRAARAARVQNALEFMGLADVGNQLVRHYSGGMIRRLEIAQAILHHPRVLFLDEPTTGLDPVARQAVWKHLQHLRTALGMTVFFTTHFMEEADQWCTRLAVMTGGRIVAEGTPTQLKRRLGCEGATLHHVYIRYAGHAPQAEGAYCDTARTRRNNHRLG